MRRAVVFILGFIAVIAFVTAIGAVGAFESEKISMGTCMVLFTVRMAVAGICGAVAGMIAEGE